MSKISTILVFAFLNFCFICCDQQVHSTFSEKALLSGCKSVDGSDISFDEILDKHKGQKIVIYFWASWCRDCLDNMESHKKLKGNYPNAVYLNFSLDKNFKDWQKAIIEKELSGEHYYLLSGWNSDLSEFIGLKWIPRYMVVHPSGEIAVFKAIYSTDEQFVKSLKK